MPDGPYGPMQDRLRARFVAQDPASGSASTGDASALVVVESWITQQLQQRPDEYAHERAAALAREQGRQPPRADFRARWRTTGSYYGLVLSEALQGSFRMQAARVAAIVHDPAMTHSPEGKVIPVRVLIDAGGLGMVVWEELHALDVQAEAYVWTAHAGLAAAPNSIAKARAYGRLRSVLEHDRLRIAERLPDRERIIAELASLRLVTSEQTGYQTLQTASGGLHDDFAAALAMTVYVAECTDTTDPDDWETVRFG